MERGLCRGARSSAGHPFPGHVPRSLGHSLAFQKFSFPVTTGRKQRAWNMEGNLKRPRTTPLCTLYPCRASSFFWLTRVYRPLHNHFPCVWCWVSFFMSVLQFTTLRDTLRCILPLPVNVRCHCGRWTYPTSPCGAKSGPLEVQGAVTFIMPSPTRAPCVPIPKGIIAALGSYQ